jgi:ribose/xylose/arabinose/galactoside ABC-type transport system permease subunit
MQLRRILSSEHLVLYLSCLYFLVFWPLTPGLASSDNLLNILSNLLPLLVVAIGQTFVLVTGGIDLSVTAVIALASVLGATVMTGHHPLPGGAFAVGMGLANGSVITLFRMPPFIVTLTMMMFGNGFAIWFTQSQNIANLPAGFKVIGMNVWLSLLVTGMVTIAAHITLSRTLLGRWLYAVGHNARAALISGVPVAGIILIAYLVSGLCAAMASVLYTGRLETGSPVLGQRILLDVIGAAVIGGTSLFGGKGKILWTVYGVLFITLIDNSLTLLSLSHFTIMIIKGAVILLAALIDTARNRLGDGKCEFCSR